MDNQKIENLLNVSLQVSEAEREKSPSLSEGYYPEDNTWELIVKYIKDIDYLATKYPGIIIKKLLNQYAILICPEQYITALSLEVNIEYIEKPKRLLFELQSGRSESCINTVQEGINNPYELFGDGIIVAIIDSGIDAKLADFRNPDGTTRIINIWDQALDIELNQQQINESLLSGETIAGNDFIRHGTDVALIACGNDGIASKADIIAVKMGLSDPKSFPRTTQLMEAVNYVVKKGIEYNKPVAINLSFGNNYGDHTGTSLVEAFLNDISGNGRTTIVVGTGNEGLGATHASGNLKAGEYQDVELAINEYETSINLQIWSDYWNLFDVEIITPSGLNLGKISRFSDVSRLNSGKTTILSYYGQPSPFSVRKEIYIDLIPKADYIDSGIWTFRIIPESIRSGRYDIWLPAISSLNIGTGFLRPASDLTFTIPSTATKVISVGAYDSRTFTTASFSGRGFVAKAGATQISKPELVAPGVNIVLKGKDTVTGTSFATPFVTGAAALLMEWGIVKGNDLFLYGEKVKAYLINGARKLPEFTQYPTPQVGWGTLCVRDSLPI